MFSGLNVADVRHSRRWTALASFVLQGILVSAALILPLLHPTTLPFPVHHVWLPMPKGDPHISARQQNVQQQGGGIQVTPLMVRHVFIFHPGGSDSARETQAQAPGLGPEGGPGVGDDRIMNLFSENTSPVLSPPSPKPPRISAMMEGNLIHRVEPPYPPIAKQIRLQGTVLLHAIVTADGTVEHIQAVSGPAILAQAAIQAVRQWRYRPYSLNGMPVPVETEITVKFILNQ